MTKRRALYISGEWISGYGKPLISKNPATGEAVWEADGASKSDVGRAVKGSIRAKSSWAKTPIAMRKEVLQKFGDALKSHEHELTEIITKETGKPLWEAKTEVAAAIGKISLSIQAFEKRCSEVSLKHPSGNSFTRHKPIGILAVLGPFNFPLHLPNGHIVPAILAGNTIVFKPSEHTPFTAEWMVKCWEEAGLPEGVLNLVPGSAETGKWVTEHPEVDGVLFTGSYKTGCAISKTFAKTPEKILALEMGGNNPLVVGNCSDVEAAVFLIIQSAFLTAGQRCTCARRLMVPKGDFGDVLIQKLVKATKTFKVGPSTDQPEPFMGPVISEKTALHLLMKQAALQTKGAVVLQSLSHLKPGTGLVTPGILDVTSVKEDLDEEIFGPLLFVIRVENLEESIVKANQTSYGLSAGILSDSEAEYQQFFDGVNAGVVNWNTALTGASSAAPFGGIGKSGNHRPSGFWATDYCSYPIASLENSSISLPKTMPPGIHLTEPDK